MARETREDHEAPKAVTAEVPAAGPGELSQAHKVVETTPDLLIVRLVRSSQNGRPREEDFRRLFERYSQRIWVSFPRDLVSPEERSELTQEVFFAVYRGMEGCPTDREAFERWIHRVARNMFLTWRQRRGRQKRRRTEISLEDLPDSGAFLSVPIVPDPLVSAVESERRRSLHAAIATLPEQMRKCVALRVAQDLSVAEIAVVLRLRPGTVKAHLHQARGKLRELLGEQFEGVDV